jgi:hypothetical protein
MDHDAGSGPFHGCSTPTGKRKTRNLATEPNISAALQNKPMISDKEHIEASIISRIGAESQFLH